MNQNNLSFETQGRLSGLDGGGQVPNNIKKRTYIVRALRYILPIIALVMVVIIATWDDAGRSSKPIEKADILPQSENIQNELLAPVFNSVDDKNQPYTVTALRAVQSKSNPDVMELEKPVATLTQSDTTKLEGQANIGLYEQKSQKLNLKGDVVLTHSDGYKLTTPELRIDIVAQKAYSGQDVFLSGAAGSLKSKGLVGDMNTGIITFTGPARVVLYSDGQILNPKGQTP